LEEVYFYGELKRFIEDKGDYEMEVIESICGG